MAPHRDLSGPRRPGIVPPLPPKVIPLIERRRSGRQRGPGFQPGSPNEVRPVNPPCSTLVHPPRTMFVHAMDDKLEAGLEKAAVATAERHLFLCMGPECCTREEAEELWEVIKKR